MKRSSTPTDSMMNVERMTDLRMKKKSRRGVCRNVLWTISRPLKEIPRPMIPKRKAENVMMPSPPNWKRQMRITCPAVVRSVPTSTVASPVTQTAEADMNRASTKRNPFVEAKGSHSRTAPARTRPAKLRMKILAGVRCLERD